MRLSRIKFCPQVEHVEEEEEEEEDTFI